MEISDHKRETWALYRGLRLRPSIPAKATEVHFKEKKKLKSLVLVIVGFHTDFHRAIATSFKDADLQDILMQSSVLANEFAERAITFNDKRSVQKCKLMYEALNRMLIMDMEKCGIYRRCLQCVTIRLE